MNKKTLAIAAFALIATSGLASARTIHSPKQDQAVQSETATTSTSPYDALNQYGDNAQGEVFAHPGDNDMDRYNVENAD